MPIKKVGCGVTMWISNSTSYRLLHRLITSLCRFSSFKLILIATLIEKGKNQLMDSIVYSTTGLIHLIFSILAMILGAIVIFSKKGTDRHKKIGYAYAVSMVVCIATAFMIYRLFNGWGIFHYMAVVSSLSLIFGLVPAILRRPEKSWIGLHFGFMYWSVVGLYAAFISETITRTRITDMTTFSVILFIYFGLCSFFFQKQMKVWKATFMSTETT